jgi:hypothetical protein
MNDQPRAGYVLKFEEDRLNDPDVNFDYPVCQDFVNHYRHYRPKSIEEYLGAVPDEHLERIEIRLNGFYLGDQQHVQELLLLYTLWYEMENGSREIPIDGNLHWLISIMRNVAHEKQNRGKEKDLPGESNRW